MTVTSHSKIKTSQLRISASDVLAQAWKVAVALALVGGVAAAVGYTANPQRFAFSYLFAFLCFLFVGLGALFYVMLLHLTSAGWGVTTRRTAEFFVAGVPILALLFLPVIPVMQHLYPWYQHEVNQESFSLLSASKAGAQEASPSTEAHGKPSDHHAATQSATKSHEDGVAQGHHDGGHDPAHMAHEAIVKKKHTYLNKPFFLLRMLLYFAVWAFLAVRLVSLSMGQDDSKDLRNTVKLQQMAAPGIIALALTSTFAALDWIMSLEPAWYSTIFGVCLFASSVVAIFAAVIVTTLALRSCGYLGDAVNVEHYHDLGKLMFGFIVFWAYVGFSQLLLIWYAGIPEEATFYHRRWDGGVWQGVSLFLLCGHFFFPFLLVLSRNMKRRLSVLGFAAGWMLILHLVEMYWFVMPYYPSAHFGIHWLDVACLLFVGGVYTAIVLRSMARHPLVPIGDPRLNRSLHFENA